MKYQHAFDDPFRSYVTNEFAKKDGDRNARCRTVAEANQVTYQVWCSNFPTPRSGRKYIAAGSAIMTSASGV